jgi:dihydroorotate dehydrogenase
VSLYSALARPVLFALDAERAHDLTMAALRLPGLPQILGNGHAGADARLQQTVFGLTFPNPIGLAAGLDKQGTAIKAWPALGFGFAEIGTVTPRAQPGNERPRLFRLRGDRAVINRFGFNSEGADTVAANLTRSGALRRAGASRAAAPFQIGINIGKNKATPNEAAADDYLSAVDVLHSFADYIVINVSSPNTAGLRALQDRHALRPLVEQVTARVKAVARHEIPVLVKVSPDLDERDLLESVDAAAAGGASGVIATNTTTSREGIRFARDVALEPGGLSGAPLRDRADRVCRVLFRHLRGRLPIIGVGGIFTPEDAYRRIRSGASLLQLYTGFIYEGPAIVSRIAKGLTARVERDGFQLLSDAVGIDAD